MRHHKTFTYSRIAVAILAGLAMASVQAKNADHATPAHAGTPTGSSSAPAAAAQAAQPASASSTQSKKPVQLQTITVKSFISDAGKSAMKLNLPVRDTPFSISTYTSSFMHAIEAQKVATLYPYMTGIQSAGITGYDLVFRGFKSGGNDADSILVDGLPGLATRFGSPVTIGISHIDVVRGPSSVLNGQEQPGGFINLITKKPQPDPYYEFDATATTYDGAGVGISDKPGLNFAADLTGPVNQSGTVMYRLIMSATNKDTYRTNSYDKDIYFAPSLTWNISDRTSLTAAYVFQRLHYSYDTYLVAPNSDINLVPKITTRYQEPSDNEREHGSVLTLMLKHHFTNGMTWNLDTRNVWHTDSARGFDVTSIRPDLLHVGRRARGQLNTRRYDYLDTNLQMPVSLFGIDHKMVVGMTEGRIDNQFDRLQFFNGPATGPTSLDIAIYDPIYHQVPPLWQLPLGNSNGSLNDRNTQIHSTGAYFDDMMTLSSHWKAAVGGRYTRISQTYFESFPLIPGRTAASSKTNTKLLPMAGLVYQPDKHWSYYVSYSTSFVPPPPQAINEQGINDFVPTYAHQVELGTKTNWLDGRLRSTLALYQINEQDTLSHSHCPIGTCYQQVGKARSRGAEFEINAMPLPNWQLTAGYSYTNARITNSTNPAQIDTRLPDVPVNSEHLWSRYDFTSHALNGLGFGLGVIHNGQREGVTPKSFNEVILKLPAYTRVDAALYYEKASYSLTLKVENLFDTTYYQSAGFNGDINLLPGVPRLITLSTRIFFD